MQDYTPQGDWLIVRMIPEAKVLRKGIIVAHQTNMSRMIYADVLCAGPGAINDRGTRVPMECAVNDVVMFSRAETIYPIDILDANGDLESVLMIQARRVMSTVSPHKIIRESDSLVGLDGSPLPITTAIQSRALPDQVYANRDSVARAVKGGWVTADEYVDEFPPGDPGTYEEK